MTCADDEGVVRRAGAVAVGREERGRRDGGAGADAVERHPGAAQVVRIV